MIFTKSKFLFIIFLLIFSSLKAQRTFISNIVSQVNIDTLMLTARQLSGDTTFLLNNKTDSIKNRCADSADVKKAAQLIQEKLSGFGIKVTEQPFLYGQDTGRNIIGFQQGTLATKNCFMLTAHYDNMPPAYVNHGADDNASGVSAVIEAARILSKYSLPYSIYYVLFDYEEQGKIGSAYFCNKFDNTLEPVISVINMDMIAYDGNNDSVANIHIRSVGGDSLISNQMLSVNKTYQSGLQLKIINPSNAQSDHLSFWNNLLPAVLFIEDDKNDFNPNWHQVTDKINLFNKSYFQRMVKLAIATIADFASDSSHVGLNEKRDDKKRISVYPNPAATEINIEVNEFENFYVQLFDISGKCLTEHILFESKTKINTQSLSQGFYFLRIEIQSGLNATLIKMLKVAIIK